MRDISHKGAGTARGDGGNLQQEWDDEASRPRTYTQAQSRTQASARTQAQARNASFEAM